MNYNSIKNKTFSENPAVKAEYDQLVLSMKPSALQSQVGSLPG